MHAFEEYLLQLPRYGDKGRKALNPGFDRVLAMMAAMGQPHEKLPSIHIAGTNGKGSTASLLASILCSAGYPRVGLYTSPHLVSMRERIRIDGAPVPTVWMNATVQRYRSVMDEVQPSFFEAMTALAFLYFADQRVSFAVVEAGLGGRLDATNILSPRLTIITCIDYDHMNVLGYSLGAIAREKGGIIKPEVPLVTAASQPEALEELSTIAAFHRAPMHVVHWESSFMHTEDRDGLTLRVTTPGAQYEALRLGIGGAHQATNALLAIRAAELLGETAQRGIQPGLANVRSRSGLRGRLEAIATRPRIIVDVAHNPAGLRCVLGQVRAQCRGRLFVLFGQVRSKDLRKMAQALYESRAIVYTCNVAARRGISAEDLAETLRAWHVPVARSGTWQQALRRAIGRALPDDVILVCGSHYLAGAFLAGWPAVKKSSTTC